MTYKIMRLFIFFAFRSVVAAEDKLPEVKLSDRSGKNYFAEVSRLDLKKGNIYLTLVGGKLKKVRKVTYRFTRHEPTTKKTPFIQRKVSSPFRLNLKKILGPDSTTFHYLVEYQLKFKNKLSNWSPKFPLVVSTGESVLEGESQVGTDEKQPDNVNENKTQVETGVMPEPAKANEPDNKIITTISTEQIEQLHKKVTQEIDEQKWPEALENLNTLIAQAPQFEFYFLRSKVHTQLKNMSAALGDLDQALKLNTEDLNAHYERAMLRKKMEDVDGATQDFDFVLNQNNNHLNALLQKASLMLEKGEARIAVELLNRALKNKNDWAAAYALRAAAYVKLMVAAKALDDYNKALTYNPDFPEVYYNRAVAFLKQNNLVLACKDFKEALQRGISASQDALNKYCAEAD